jgi:hypothetical protein
LEVYSLNKRYFENTSGDLYGSDGANSSVDGFDTVVADRPGISSIFEGDLNQSSHPPPIRFCGTFGAL